MATPKRTPIKFFEFVAKFSSLVDKFVSLVDKFESLVDEFNSLVVKFNPPVDEFNSLVVNKVSEVILYFQRSFNKFVFPNPPKIRRELEIES